MSGPVDQAARIVELEARLESAADSIIAAMNTSNIIGNAAILGRQDQNSQEEKDKHQENSESPSKSLTVYT
ncbi:hypothetical protein V494_05378 [Pseudogymnoascus sp. VKM F-4513 (FW-928)]|nr:hypothetical protein V494_05378 [Pseudogymnoascus sp. VKM F-4513 (FW-928)]